MNGSPDRLRTFFFTPAIQNMTPAEVVIDEAADHLQAELIEIDENLCRSELTPAQRAAAIKRRKQIWEAMHPIEKGGKSIPTLGGDQEIGFASDTSTAAGLTKRSINQHLARATAVEEAGSSIADLAGTSLDKGTELDALAKLPAICMRVARRCR